jgi:hypothetical protein
LGGIVFEWILGFAIGASWVAAFGGAYLAFKFGSDYGLPTAVFAAILGLVPGFVVAALLEGIKKLFEISAEIKKQTSLIDAIAKRLQKSDG